MLRDRINAALREAMRSQDKTRTSTLRLMLAAIKDREVAMRGEDGPDRLDDRAVIELLAKMIRQREESIASYEQAARMELAEHERAEIAVIREFLPKPLTTAEVEAAIDEAITETGAASIRDMGKVMNRLKADYAGRMDFADAGMRIKRALA